MPSTPTTAEAGGRLHLELVADPLKQVAAMEKGIPNVYLAQPAVGPIVETDLRLAVNDGLDKLVLDEIAAAGFQAPGTDPCWSRSARRSRPIQAAGYNPDTLIVDPVTDEALDTMRATATAGEQIYVFGPGQEAGTIYRLNRRVAKGAPAPIVVDSTAFGRLYASAVALARFEENDGATNSSLVRLECNAVFATERVEAAVRIAARDAGAEEEADREEGSREGDEEEAAGAGAGACAAARAGRPRVRARRP